MPLTMPLHPSLDATTLQRLREAAGSDLEYRGLLREFLDSSAGLERDLTKALAQGRLTDAHRNAHSLKSMARLLGARPLAEACSQLESMTTARSTPVPPALLAATRLRLRDTQRAVESLLA